MYKKVLLPTWISSTWLNSFVSHLNFFEFWGSNYVPVSSELLWKLKATALQIFEICFEITLWRLICVGNFQRTPPRFLTFQGQVFDRVYLDHQNQPSEIHIHHSKLLLFVFGYFDSFETVTVKKDKKWTQIWRQNRWKSRQKLTKHRSRHLEAEVRDNLVQFSPIFGSWSRRQSCTIFANI